MSDASTPTPPPGWELVDGNWQAVPGQVSDGPATVEDSTDAAPVDASAGSSAPVVPDAPAAPPGWSLVDGAWVQDAPAAPPAVAAEPTPPAPPGWSLRDGQWVTDAPPGWAVIDGQWVQTGGAPQNAVSVQPPRDTPQVVKASKAKDAGNKRLLAVWEVVEHIASAIPTAVTADLVHAAQTELSRLS